MKKNMIRPLIFLIAPLILASCLASCTSYFPANLAATRVADTLYVALSGDGVARWDPEQDSLTIECKDCIPARSVAVEHFENHHYACFAIPQAEGLKLRLHSMRHDTLVNLVGRGTLESGVSPELLSLPPRYYNASANTGIEIIKPVFHKQETPAPEKPAPRPQSLIVTAPEGVAVYRDKTKKQVLKILPKGSKIILVALEGDMYSVTIDGDEGFVEAEAVKIK